jgi:hypothetical protein
MNGISVLIIKNPVSSPVPSTIRGHSEMVPSMNQEVGLHQTPDMLAL